MANINQEDVKTTSVFLSPMSCLQIITIWGARNVTTFWGHPYYYYMVTLSHNQNIVM